MSSIRSILVSGANQGLGKHAVHQLAATPNVLVFMGSRKLSAAEAALAEFKSDIHASSTVMPVQLDITDEASIANAHKFISAYLKSQNLPGLDVLVNNAGITALDFQQVYAVNVFGTAALTAVIRPLINNGGSILNVSSPLGSMAMYSTPVPIYHAYGSSKAALNCLTVQWAKEEQQKGSGIRVVALDPGFNKTNLTQGGGEMEPEDGCKVIVQAALAKEGRTGVFFSKDGDVPW
ncbi:short-chain dehydrogenase/reductase SDR [Mycena rebaudengoi]|nr:short-chain dehydrogenase/reductase SDR [Mycena rebaudengoi]